MKKQIVTITGENINVSVENVKANAENTAETKCIMMTAAEKRIAALKAAGVDVRNYFTLGDNRVIKATINGFVEIEDDKQVLDAIGKQIVEGGHVDNWKLFRRWVMSQMFHILRRVVNNKESFNGIVQSKGYEYQWKMVERELHAQVMMKKHGDTENFKRRSMWFDRSAVCEMMRDYIEKLDTHIDKLMYKRNGQYRHTCKGVPYIKFMGQNIFKDDIEEKIYKKLRELYYDAKDKLGYGSVEDIYADVKTFNRIRKHLDCRTRMSQTFFDAYKGSGAYFTMRNLIMFHGAQFHMDGQAMSTNDSLVKLDEYAKMCVDCSEKWRMVGILKQLIDDSGISINGKIDEWES